MGRVLPLAPATVPTLDELAENPARAAGLPANTLQALLCRSVTLQAALLGALVAAGTLARRDATEEADALLTVSDAAARLSTTTDWLYRHAARLPFTVRNGRQLRFSARGIARYIRERQGAALTDRH